MREPRFGSGGDGCRPVESAVQRAVARALAFVQRSWLAIALFAVAGILLLSAAYGERGMTRVLQLQAELDEANDRNFRLVQQINAQRRDLEMAHSDDATLERLARRYLSMVRPGEVLYHVPAAKDDAARGADDEATVAATSAEPAR